MDAAELQEKLNQMTSSFESLQEYCGQINEEKNSLIERLESLESEKTDLEEQYDNLKEELENTQEQLRNMQSQVDSSNTNSQTHSELMDEINNMEGELAKVTKERDELLEENKQLRNNSSDNQSTNLINEYEQKLEEKENSITDLQNTNTELQSKINELMNQLKDAQHREEDLENRLSTNEKKAEAISDSSNSDDEDIPERTIDQLKNAFESGAVLDKRTRSELQTELKEKEREIEQLKQQLKEVSENHRSVTINLPPLQEGNTTSCPPVYLDALNKLRQWYVDIESRLLIVSFKLVFLEMHFYDFFLERNTFLDYHRITEHSLFHIIIMQRFLFVFILLISLVIAFNPFPEGLKSSWPELVGKDGSVAAEEVRKECADCDIRVANQNSPMTMDLRYNRVRIFVDDENKVVSEPHRG